jgi:cobalt-zinc-cadmium efflux system protein
VTHDHSHGHDHGHSHAAEAGGSGEWRLRLALGVTAGFMLVEAAAGWWSGSLALLADAGHMLSDAGALAVAMAAARLARRPPDARRPLGWRRAEVLGATVNAAVLLALAVIITVEGLERLGGPQPVQAGPMLVVAALGLLLNLGVGAVLFGGAKGDLNLRAALWHVLGDALGSVGAIAAAGLILAFGWTLADPIASLITATIIAVGAVRILRETSEVLMQATPRGVDLDGLRALLLEDGDVRDIHDLHLWSMAPGSNVLSVHVVLEPTGDPVSAPDRLTQLLRARCLLDHVTIQVELGERRCDRAPAAR